MNLNLMARLMLLLRGLDAKGATSCVITLKLCRVLAVTSEFRLAQGATGLTKEIYFSRKNNDHLRIDYFYRHSRPRRRLERRALVMSMYPQAAIIIGALLLLWAGVCAFLIGADDGDDE
jgi:hypothetical protein